MPKVTDPILLAQLNGSRKVSDPALLAQLNGAGSSGFDTTGLAVPGYATPSNVNQVTPNEHFGMSSSDTLNPLPALSAMGNNLAASIPIAGPYLQQTGEKFDAFLDNNLYRPLTGQSGTTTPQDVAATNARQSAANPEAATVGRAAGAIAPYMAAAEVPLLNQALGFSGPTFQRMAATLGSQFTISAADNQAHGQDPLTAAKNAVFPSAVAAPLSLLGPGGRAASAYAESVTRLKQEGIPLTAGQQKGSNALMQAESQMGGIAAQNFRDKQLSSLTRTALKYAGVDAATASPAVMDKAYIDIGSKIGNLAQMTRIKLDTKLANGLVDPASTYYSATGEAVPVFKEISDQVKNAAAANGGVIPGTAYNAVSTKIGEAMKANPKISGPLYQMKEALDDAVERGMSGKTLAAFQKVRQQYANLMRVTDAVNVAGGAAKAGLITPEALDTAVRNSMSKRQYARGSGDLNQLSRDAVIAMPRLPNSGTAARVAPYMLASAAGAALHSANPMAAFGGAAASFAAPAIAGRMMLSAPGRHLLASGTNIPSVMARGIVPQIAPQSGKLIGG